jgi:hypothetical protein
MQRDDEFRRCFRDPIPEIAQAADYLNQAAMAVFNGELVRAETLIRSADMPEIREWTESIWGKASPYVKVRLAANTPTLLDKVSRIPVRMPNAAEKQALHHRDGYHCRFCGIPVVRAEVRRHLQRRMPGALAWGRTNNSQHAAFQAMWAQYDHLLPHSHGGGNELTNMVVTCGPCNFGRMGYPLSQVGLLDPRDFEPVRSEWDGLERCLTL